MPSHTPAQLGVAHKESLPVVPPCCVTRGCSFPRTGNFWEHPGHGAAPVGVTCNFPGETSCGGCTDHLQGCGALQNEFYLDSSICPLFCSSRLNFLFFLCFAISHVRLAASLVILVPRGQMTPVLKSSLHGGKSQSLIPT